MSEKRLDEMTLSELELALKELDVREARVEYELAVCCQERAEIELAIFKLGGEGAN